MKKKNIIITGTSRGIGYELVSLFTDAGHNVLALSRDAAPVSGLDIDNCACFSCDITEKLFSFIGSIVLSLKLAFYF